MTIRFDHVEAEVFREVEPGHGPNVGQGVDSFDAMVHQRRMNGFERPALDRFCYGKNSVDFPRMTEDSKRSASTFRSSAQDLPGSDPIEECAGDPRKSVMYHTLAHAG